MLYPNVQTAHLQIVVLKATVQLLGTKGRQYIQRLATAYMYVAAGAELLRYVLVHGGRHAVADKIR